MAPGAFNSEFLPVARPGDVIEFAPLNGQRQHQVVAVNPLNEITLDSGVTVADGTSEKFEVTEVEMPEGFFAQYRLPKVAAELPDGVTLQIDHDGRQEPLYQTKNVRGQISNETGVVYGDDPATADETSEDFQTAFTELFVHETSPPYFELFNRSGGQVTVNLTFQGWAFRLDRPNATVQNPIVVPVESIQ